MLSIFRGENMKILVTGYTGQLGFDVVRELKSRNIEEMNFL